MTWGLIAFLSVVVFGTSVLSSVLGMAGGMILMGVLVWTLPVESAMVVHGAIQATANGSRAFMHGKSIRWPLVAKYTLGMAIMAAAFSLVFFVPSRALVFCILGGLPFLALIVKNVVRLDILARGGALSCGIVVTAFQLTAGVSGPVLDIYYLHTAMTRHEVVAGKAITQTLGHLLKMAYYGYALFEAQSLARASEQMRDMASSLPANLPPWWFFVAAIGMAVVGTYVGKSLLDKLNDKQFFQISRAVTLVMGAVFLGRGVSMLVQGSP